MVNTVSRLIFFVNKDGEALYSKTTTTTTTTTTKARPGADCGWDHELLIAKFRFKLKKEGKPLDHADMT